MYWWFGFLPFIAAISAVLCASQAAVHHKPGVNIWHETHFNPLNVLIIPGLLSPRGLKYRFASFFFVGIFVVSVLILALLAKLH
jgi:hypothetical protein